MTKRPPYNRADKLSQGWEVEWCTSIPVDERGESEHDNATFSFRDFATEAEAMAFARTVLPQDQYGSVRVTPFHMERYESNLPGTFREYDSDCIYVESEEA